jgi:flagellar biosynthesis protein FlhG
MTVNISGPFSGHGPTIVPVQVQGASRVRETRIAITDDQATRLRAMVNALAGRPLNAPAPGAPLAGAAIAPASKPTPLNVRPPVQVAAPAAPQTARVVAVSSGKGGVGKTNTAVNLAIAITQLGPRVTLLDADLGMANADVICGLTPTRRLEQFLGVCDQPAAAGPAAPGHRPLTSSAPQRAITDLSVEAPGGFRLIPGSVGISRMTQLSGPERDRLMASLAELDASTDLVVVDTGAGLGREVLSFARAADLAIVIATPEPTSIADAYALIKCILKRDDKARPLRPQSSGGESLPRVALVVNQASGQPEAQAVHARMASVCMRFLAYQLPLLGWIPQDARVSVAIRKRSPLLVADPGAPAAEAIGILSRTIAAELRLSTSKPQAAEGSGPLPGSSVRPPQPRGGLSGLLSRVLRGR